MKEYKLCITLCMSFILLLACSKEKPPEGLYIGDFYGDILTKTNLAFTILETSETSIVLSAESGEMSVLEKNGKEITGILYHSKFQSLMDVNITGTWKKSGKHYSITGTFTANYRVATGPHVYEYYPVTGTFELKSYAI